MFTSLVNYGAPPDTSYFLGNIIGVCLNIEHLLHPLVNYHVLLTSTFFGIPSGKHAKNFGQSPFFMGKSTISMGHFQ